MYFLAFHCVINSNMQGHLIHTNVPFHCLTWGMGLDSGANLCSVCLVARVPSQTWAMKGSAQGCFLLGSHSCQLGPWCSVWAQQSSVDFKGLWHILSDCFAESIYRPLSNTQNCVLSGPCGSEGSVSLTCICRGYLNFGILANFISELVNLVEFIWI